jgi:microcystin-dependent protein
MSDPFVAEIRLFPFSFAPKGWAFCTGQLLPLSQNTALFSLLGTYYGGDGRTTFGLPNLSGAVAVHTDQYSGNGGYYIGQSGGSDNVTLISTEMPSHSHTVSATGTAGRISVPGPSYALGPTGRGTPPVYAASASATMSASAATIAGGSFPHNNLMPYLVLNYCICLQGIYPPRG